MSDRGRSDTEGERWSARDLHYVDIYVGSSIADLHWAVQERAHRQLRNLHDLIEPGRVIRIEVAVVT